jgi:hypothetical protein
MTLAAYDASRNLGEPIELYYFRYGVDAAAFHAHTDSEKPFTYAGVTYDPQPLKRGKVSSSQSLDKSVMTIQTSLSSPIAELFRVYPPSEVVTIVIRRGHVGDPDEDFGVVFTGRVQQCTRDGRQAELSCVPASTSIRRSGLRRHYQLTCPHVLYDQDDGSCKASKAAGTISPVVVQTVQYLTFTLPVAWAGALDTKSFVGGMVEWAGPNGTERRSIIRVSTDGLTITLNGPTSGLVDLASVAMVLGCPHNLAGCESLHNNILNYGGMPYIPSENPIKSNPFT